MCSAVMQEKSVKNLTEIVVVEFGCKACNISCPGLVTSRRLTCKVRKFCIRR